MTNDRKRQFKSKRKESWTDSRIEIRSIVKLLGIPDDRFKETDIYSWENIQKNIRTTFSTHSHSNWIWQTLKVPSYSVSPPGNPIQCFDQLIETDEKVWLLINETVREETKFWIFEGYITEIKKIIGEMCLIDEIIVVSKKYEWILLVNHHTIITVTGPLIDKLKKIE